MFNLHTTNNLRELFEKHNFKKRFIINILSVSINTIHDLKYTAIGYKIGINYTNIHNFY